MLRPDVFGSGSPGLRVRHHLIHHPCAQRWKRATESRAARGHDKHVVLARVLQNKAEGALVPVHGPREMATARGCSQRGRPGRRWQCLGRAVARALVSGQRSRPLSRAALGPDVVSPRKPCLGVSNYGVHHSGTQRRQRPAVCGTARRQDKHVILADVLLDEAIPAPLPVHGAATLPGPQYTGETLHLADDRVVDAGGLGPDVLSPRPPRLRVPDHIVRHAGAQWRKGTTKGAATRGHEEHVLLPRVLLDESKAALIPVHRAGPVMVQLHFRLHRPLRRREPNKT
mmetsp:Transcript_109756/g.354363  ORF Transcript_109756/g.354363 Transcript_109756/m.354363 type:complete len:285 (-) Transcript_109756:20-874(-)